VCRGASILRLEETRRARGHHSFRTENSTFDITSNPCPQEVFILADFWWLLSVLELIIYKTSGLGSTKHIKDQS
jgi:hypothetical protein